ncbi:MAG: hypothetical protein WDA00_06035 [Eubacteriales bacterium]
MKSFKTILRSLRDKELYIGARYLMGLGLLACALVSIGLCVLQQYGEGALSLWLAAHLREAVGTVLFSVLLTMAASLTLDYAYTKEKSQE